MDLEPRLGLFPQPERNYDVPKYRLAARITEDSTCKNYTASSLVDIRQMIEKPAGLRWNTKCASKGIGGVHLWPNNFIRY
jgi:hypothetical protein